MKNLVTAIGSVLIILMLIMQIVQCQKVYVNMVRTERAADAFAENVRLEGYVSPKSGEILKTSLASIAECSKEEVEIMNSLENTGVCEGINIDISFPYKNPVFYGSFWGISEKDNTIDCNIRRYVVLDKGDTGADEKPDNDTGSSSAGADADRV